MGLGAGGARGLPYPRAFLCPAEHVFNVFHPFDPLASRVEPLVDAALQTLAPVLVPHHQGRKRIHLGAWSRPLAR